MSQERIPKKVLEWIPVGVLGDLSSELSTRPQSATVFRVTIILQPSSQQNKVDITYVLATAELFTSTVAHTREWLYTNRTESSSLQPDCMLLKLARADNDFI